MILLGAILALLIYFFTIAIVRQNDELDTMARRLERLEERRKEGWWDINE